MNHTSKGPSPTPVAGYSLSKQGPEGLLLAETQLPGLALPLFS